MSGNRGNLQGADRFISKDGEKEIDEVSGMCRNIRPLYNFAPPATEEEIRAAALQYVRKISGFTRPSAANEVAFNLAVDEIAKASATLLGALVTSASPKDRETEAAKARERSVRRFR
jgi:hypothetical protein